MGTAKECPMRARTRGLYHGAKPVLFWPPLPLPQILNEADMKSEQTLSDLVVANAAKDAERHVLQLKFLEAEIKTLIGAIRTAPDVESLRVVANDTVERLRKHSLEMEKARLHTMHDEATSLPRVREKV
jgi:hypothetical protein